MSSINLEVSRVTISVSTGANPRAIYLEIARKPPNRLDVGYVNITEDTGLGAINGSVDPGNEVDILLPSSQFSVLWNFAALQKPRYVNITYNDTAENLPVDQIALTA